MRYYVSTPTSASSLDECRRLGFGEFCCPVRGRRGQLGIRGDAPRLQHYAIDNGAWLFHTLEVAPDFGPFAAALQRYGARADFVVAPDIVAGGAASLDLSVQWLDRCLDHAAMVLIPVQDGMVPADVVALLGARVGIFVGGSTVWKWSTAEQWADVGRKAGAHVHVGRVNTRRRADFCADLGVSSADGSTVARFSSTAHRMAAAVDPLRHRQTLIRTT